jgi:LysR family glycine cleavage system transcriptional activator
MSRPDLPRLPPLSSLRAFEAVVRHGSVKAGADELRLTPSAISHQLRNLEEHVGVALFHRRPRSIELTETGAALAIHVERAFRELRQGIAALRNQKESSVLRVSAPPILATELIMPSSQDFERRHTAIQLRLEVSETVADFDAEPIDVAIRFGPAPSNALFSEMLLDATIAPVCAPSLLRGTSPLRTIEDLSRHALLTLSENTDGHGWEHWVAAAGFPDLKPARQLWFDTFLGAVQAAEAGLGILIAPHPTVAGRLADGRLVLPFPVFASSAWSYRFVCRRGQERIPKIDQFRRWIGALCEQRRSATLTDELRRAAAIPA